jgi:hypothetical protein
MFIPFPDHLFEPVQGRNIPDTRNSAVYSAIHGGFDYHMQIDEDQRFNWDFFLKLYGGIQEYGQDTIVTGWSKCKSGPFAGKPNIYRCTDDGVDALTETELQTSPEYIEVDSFGTSGFLAPTSIFKKFEDPWFADINIIHDDKRIAGLYAGTQFAVGQDLFLARRLIEAGVKIVCATKARMPHMVITEI